MVQTGKKRKIFDERYEILSIVGRGSASVVYHARHVAGNESDVALKVLLNRKVEGSSTADLLRKEALAMVSARHKYVVRLDDFHSVGDLAYLSMEYAPEFDLRRYVQKMGGKLSLQQAELFFLQMAVALQFTHTAGIIHRDLKPDNILVMNEKEVRLADFGTALLPGENSSLEDLRKGVGTMSYMAPEVLNGTACDQRSDIYALATAFYEMLSGQHPFESAPLLEQIEIRKDGAFKPLLELAPDVPAHLATTIMRAMSFEPEARFESAKAMQEALLNDAGGQPTARPARKPSRQRLKKEPRTEMPAENEATTSAEAASKEAAKEASPGEYPRGIHQVPKQAIEAAEVARKATVFIPNDKREELAASPAEEPRVDIIEPAYEETEISSTVEKPSKQPRSEKKIPSPTAQKGSPGITIAAVAAFVLLMFFAKGWLGSLFWGSEDSAKNETQQTVEHSPLPVFQGEELSFPLLPAGVYSGSISELKPGQSVSLSIISMPDWDKLVVIAGIEGWTPAVISYTNLATTLSGSDAKPLRVKSNGFVLDLTGQIANAGVIGYYRNIITGEQGEWKITPQS